MGPFGGAADDLDDDDEGVPLGEMVSAFDAHRDNVADDIAKEALRRAMRAPQANLDAERALLGAFFVDNRALDSALEQGLIAEEFFRRAHQLIYAGMAALRERGTPVDLLTLTDELTRRGTLDAVGGAAPLAQLESMLPTAAHAPSYVAMVKDKAEQRRVLEVMHEGTAMMLAGRSRPHEVARHLETKLTAIKPRTHVSGWQAKMERAREALALVGVKKRVWDGPAGKSALDLARADIPPPPWVVQGLIRERAVVVYGGPPKAGKTWEELELAIAVSSGTPAFAEFGVGHSGPVQMFCLEDDERDLRTRFRALAVGRQMSLEAALSNIRVEARGTLDLFSDEDCAGIIASAWSTEEQLGEPVALLTLDPLRDANTGEENSNDDMRRLMHRVRAIRDIVGCAVLLVHHLSKPGEAKRTNDSGGSIFDRFRGAGALRGAWDAGIGKDPKFRSPTLMKSRMEVETRGGRGAGVFGLELDIADDAWGDAVSVGWRFWRDWKEMVAEDKGAGGLSEGEMRALELLKTSWGADRQARREPVPLSSARVADALGVSAATAKRLLRSLVDRGLAAGHTMGTTYQPKEETDPDDR